MINNANKIIDKFLINKNLKFFLFLLICALIIFIFIITPIMLEKNKLEFKDIIAPIIISISALLASTVAMINLRTNAVNKIIDNNRQDISEINYLLMTLNMINNKLDVYKKIVYQEQQVDLYELLEYKKLFLQYEEFFKNKTLIYYSANYNKKNIFSVLNNIENCLVFISMYNKESLKSKEKFNENTFGFLPKKEYIKKHIDVLIENSQELSTALREYNKTITNKQSHLCKTENY